MSFFFCLLRGDNINYAAFLFLFQNAIQKLFKDNVEALHRQKRYKLIHLLYSGPAGLTIELGQSINPNMWHVVVVYEYKYRGIPRYKRTFNI
ncbi:MAG: SAVED domain-containing protein [Bacillota bacterium]